MSKNEKWNIEIFKFLTLFELLNFSLTSKEISKLKISLEIIENLLLENKQTKEIPFQLFFNLNSLTLQLLRKQLFQFFQQNSSLSSSSSSSSATSLSSTLQSSILQSSIPSSSSIIDESNSNPNNPNNNNMDVVPIEKHLESNSFDEYDDFNPRHPDYKSHRRGGSFFNSDLSDIAAQVYATDLSLIAKKALDLEADDMI